MGVFLQFPGCWEWTNPSFRRVGRLAWKFRFGYVCLLRVSVAEDHGAIQSGDGPARLPLNPELQEQYDTPTDQNRKAEQSGSVASRYILQRSECGWQKESAQSARRANDPGDEFDVRGEALWRHLEGRSIPHAEHPH